MSNTNDLSAKPPRPWKKLGRIYDAPALHPKLASHAANPLPVLIKDDVFRIYFSGRDSENRSSVGFVDIDICKQLVLRASDEPVFAHGPDGSFYSHGVSIGNCYEVAGQRYMLFMGWRMPAEGHWYGEIGRLRVAQDYSLELDRVTPLMPLDSQDSISLSYPWVQEESGLYHMWYGSTLTWQTPTGGMLHTLNYATSHDGSHWTRNGLSVPYEIGVAQAFSRPTVLGNCRDGYEMWFSYRDDIGMKYRIGYATSQSGERWNLALDAAGITVSATGWDHEMIEYPYVFQHKGQTYMLYCGNGYGKSGFGLAIRDDS